MRLVLYTDDATKEGDTDELVTAGVVELDHASGRWWARHDWHALRHVSELDEVERLEYLKFRPRNLLK